MKLEQIVRLLRANWFWLAASTLAGCALAAAITFFIPEKYSTSTSIYISAQYNIGNSQAAYQASLLSEQRVTSYSQLLTSTRIGDEVSRQIGGLTGSQVLDRMSVNAPAGSVLLTLNVTDSDPNRAAEIANTASTAFTRLVAELETPLEQNAPPSVVARTVEPAVADSTPISPRWPLNLSLGLVVGLLAGLIIVVMKETLDTRVKTSKDFVSLELIDLGEISNEESGAKVAYLPTRDDPYSSVAEEYRKVRTNLDFVRAAGQRKVLVFSSAVPGEGKTTTCCNLAVAIANTGLRVLLVDADLRKPRVAEIFGLETAVGLTSVLVGKIEASQAVQPSGIANLDLMASGPQPPNPSELLGSAACQDTLRTLSQRYDFLLIDSPPLLPVTDASVAAAHADGVVLVCRLSSTTFSQLTAARDQIVGVGANVLGAVGNMGRGTLRKYGASYYGTYGGRPQRENDFAATAQMGKQALRNSSSLTQTPSPGPRPRR